MVTKPTIAVGNPFTSFILAKELMVTKLAFNAGVDVTGFILAKELMVTKLFSLFNPFF